MRYCVYVDYVVETVLPGKGSLHGWGLVLPDGSMLPEVLQAAAKAVLSISPYFTITVHPTQR